MKYVWPPLINAIEKRQKEIADGLSNAEKAKKNLELANNGVKEALQEAKAQAQKIVDEATKENADPSGSETGAGEGSPSDDPNVEKQSSRRGRPSSK